MSTTHDFGAGPIPAHRHENGGGWVADSATVHASAHIAMSAVIGPEASIGARASIQNSRDVLHIPMIGSRDDSLTIYPHQDGGVHVRHGAGCEHESLDAFESAVRAKHGDNIHAREYLAVIALARVRFGRLLDGREHGEVPHD